MASATLSRSEFDAACRAFAARDPAGGVAWAWVGETSDAPFGPRPGFLRSAALLVPPPREHAAASADATAETSADAECTDEAELADAPTRAHRLELHIAYSHTYSVPLLLLQGYDADGAPWTDSAVNAHLSGCCEGAPLPPGAVTQTMHPSLDVPYYCVHPCHTAERMGHLLSSGDGGGEPARLDHLSAWWAMMAPLVGGALGAASAAEWTASAGGQCRSAPPAL